MLCSRSGIPRNAEPDRGVGDGDGEGEGDDDALRRASRFRRFEPPSLDSSADRRSSAAAAMAAACSADPPPAGSSFSMNLCARTM